MRVDPSLAARKVALDRLGVWLMIGLLVFTAVRPFDSVDWLIDNDETSRALTVATTLFFSLVMALLFVLGGVAAWFAGTRRAERRSTSEFVRERTVRLGVPLVTGMLVLAPFQAWVVSWHNGFYSGSFWGFVPVWVDNPIPASSPAVIGGPGGYLWFLAFLLAFGLLTWPLQGWLRGTGARWVRMMADSVTEHRGSILLGVVPLVAVRQALLSVSPDRYGLSSFAYFIIFFVYGLLMLQDSRFVMVMRRDWWFGATAAAIALGAIVMGAGSGLLSESSWFPTSGPDLGTVVLNLAGPFAAYGGAVTMLAAALTWLARPTALLQQGQSVILAWYVVHQPVVVSIAAYVVTKELGFGARLASTVLVSLVVAVVLVETIRRVPLLRRLMSVTPSVAAIDAVPVPASTALMPLRR